METCLPSGRLCRLLTSLNLDNHSPRHQAFQVSRATAGTQMWLWNPGRASHAGDTEDRQARGLLAVLPLLSPYNRGSPTRKGGVPAHCPERSRGREGAGLGPSSSEGQLVRPPTSTNSASTAGGMSLPAPAQRHRSAGAGASPARTARPLEPSLVLEFCQGNKVTGLPEGQTVCRAWAHIGGCL